VCVRVRVRVRVCVWGLAGACEARYPAYTVVLSFVWLFFHAHILEALPPIKCMAHLVIFCMYLI